MMRVIIEIHPGGDCRRKREIARFDISNVSELADISDYQVDAFIDGQAQSRYHLRGHTRAGGWVPIVQRVIGHALEHFRRG